ncbi:MAG: class I fructose-bisphosphate aldolase [Candidatus Bipolaricaulia bacterium]
MSVTPRLNRLLAADGKCFDVAIDHGFFNEVAFLSGIENMHRAITAIVEAAPDAIQLTVGQARILQQIPGKEKPSLVLRTDAANVYGKDLPHFLFNQLIDNPVEQALALDTTSVVTNLLLLPDQPELHHQCIENICRLKPDCEYYGMPLMIEPLVMKPNQERGGYQVDGDLNKILGLVRQAVELGADVIKADPCDNVQDYYQVVEIAGDVPILVRGGGKVSDEEILKRTAELIEQGAAGIVYGRNVIHHENPVKMTQALMAVVHDGASPEEALSILRS